MANPKGNPNLTGGSRKGVPNKNTALLKDMILKALEGAGGVDYLIQQADANPGPFMTLVGKVLPLQIAGDPNGAPIAMSLNVSNLSEAALRELAALDVDGAK